jgi:gas vesicle protein
MKNRSGRGYARANQSLAFLVGLLIGGLTGAAVMLLWAPRSGEKTRSQLQKQGEKLRRHAVEGVEEAVTEAGDKANEFTEGVRHEVSELQKNAQDLIRMGKK